MNELEIMRINIEAKKKLAKNTLIDRLEALRTKLDVEIERLKNEDDYSPSLNGIIQSESSVIDTLASRLATLEDLSKIG